MAASDGKALTMEKLSLQNETGSAVYTLFVHQDVMESCKNDKHIFLLGFILINKCQQRIINKLRVFSVVQIIRIPEFFE